MPHRFMGLIADIGGTNARFALCSDEGEILSPLTLLCRDFPSLELAVKAYLEKIEYRGPAIKRAAFAVACPVLGDRISMTNSDWSFSVSEVKSVLDLDSLDVVNDFVAQALAANPKQVAEYKAGNEKVIQYLMGQVMRLSRGRANPQIVMAELKKQLSA